jgi:hypothetical protein
MSSTTNTVGGSAASASSSAVKTSSTGSLPRIASRSGPSVRDAIRSSHADSSTRARPAASSANARIRLVLPIPASPVTSTTEPRPPAASFTAIDRSASVDSRSSSMC